MTFQYIQIKEKKLCLYLKVDEVEENLQLGPRILVKQHQYDWSTVRG